MNWIEIKAVQKWILDIGDDDIEHFIKQLTEWR